MMAEAAVRVRPEAGTSEVFSTTFDAAYTWNYDVERIDLRGLYEKAKRDQWNATDQLAWSTSVDPESEIIPDIQVPVYGTHIWDKLTPAEVKKLRREALAWTLSQFMHGEQGALLCTAKIVETVPWIDAKYYASTQVMDEARHVEVFAKYLDDKLSGHYPINAHLKMLLDDIIQDSRWDMTYLGMQIMVEGLALAAFGFMHQLTTEPLLKQLLRYVMADEARHVAFGVLSLKEFYEELTAAEIRERQEFAFEAAVRMRDRFLQQEVWDRMGVPVQEAVSLMMQTDEQKVFQSMLFSKIVPNCKKLGLLDAADGWLRMKFTELGVIAFEDWADTGSEYDQFAIGEQTPNEQAASA
jgi:hypothetical protein